MSTLNLYVASNPLNRAISLTDAHGHSLPPLSWVLSDVFPVVITVETGSNFSSTVGTTASASVGLNNGGAPLTLDGLTIAGPDSYTGQISLNTYELSASLTGRSKTFTFELQITSGSDIQTYQHDVNIRRELITNPLVHVSTITAIVSASYSAYAVSSSHAESASWASNSGTTITTGSHLPVTASWSDSSSFSVSASYAPKQWNETATVLWTDKRVGIGTDTPSEKLDIVSGSIVLRGNYPSISIETENPPPDGNNASVTLDTSGLNISDNAAGEVSIQLYNAETALGLFHNGDAYTIRFTTNGDSFIDNPYNFGIGPQAPAEKLEVSGNILCHNITASNLLGTASWSNNSITSSFITASNIRGVVVSASHATNADISISSSYALSSSYSNNSTSASYSLNSNTSSFITASNVIGTVISASYATTATTCSGIVNTNQITLTSGFANYYAASVTASNTDNGRVMVFTSGSKCFMTGSLSSTFSAMIIQCGSGQIAISASSDTTLKNRQNQYSTAGQYGIISVIRLADGAFYIGGDTA